MLSMTTINHITKVQKRNGDIMEFVPEKIFNAVFKAITATKQGNGKRTEEIAQSVIKILNRRFKKMRLLLLNRFKILLKRC